MKTVIINGLAWDTRNLRRSNSNYHKFNNAQKLAKKSNKRLPSTREWRQLLALGHTFDKKKKGIWLGHDHELKSKSIRSIFLPAAGYLHINSTLNLVSQYGYYWSAAHAGSYGRYMYFYSIHVNSEVISHHAYGFSVRCVQDIPSINIY